MTDRTAYTDEEWGQLIAAPAAVISAVIGASPGGPVAIMQEVGAAVKFFEETARTRQDNPLIGALLVTLKGHFESYLGKGSPDEAVAGIDIMAMGKDPQAAVAMVGVVPALLAAKGAGAAGDELRVWLNDLAHIVAQAASEGGFLGIGGEQVNAAEAQILAEIGAALGLTDGAAR
jgi:hypothetical protein